MSRKSTPPPESRFLGEGAVIVLILALPSICLWLIFDKWWLLATAIPLVFYILDLLYGMALLIAARLRWRGRDMPGILVYSDSPNWKVYIEENWLTRLSKQVVVLNWSQRSTWRSSLPVLLFNHFGSNFNFNPLFIRLRGLRHPLVYRFFFAFRDARHGRPEALERLEQHMFSELKLGGLQEEESDNRRVVD